LISLRNLENCYGERKKEKVSCGEVANDVMGGP